MTERIKVENLYKVFGKNPKSILKKLKEGMPKDEILKKTDHAVGVNDVSFNVNEGEIFVIMGLSGSGKSTLIRCLNLLHKPTGGDIIIDGDNIVKYDKQQLRDFRQNKIAMVFQHFGLFNHRTVLENVEYGLEVKNVSKEERRKVAERTLAKVGLEGWGDSMPHQLSGGMRQRVGLARALANDPDILLMDEPFSALDPLIRREMQLELLDIQSELKKIIIFITHDVNEAFKIGDRVAVMKDGKMVQVGTPEEILTNPTNAYIEDFIKDIDKSKILQAKHIMSKSTSLALLKNGPKVAMEEMKQNGLSSVFVVDKDRKLHGIVTIDDTIQAIKENKSLEDILKKDYFTAGPETYIQSLLPMITETKFPIAIVDDSNKFLGIVLRVSILSGIS
ncbi:quaternary amine ABC transporter ATP-binding protein [Anaerosolibacter sp.]|uniref:quaternary amine ABC transporter ATP-binding protein n=1 Tax=Anaerosolibacter sp. TaxID=1872527 RepID=UPI0039EE6235